MIFVLTVSSVFVVFEGQRGIVFQFSKIKRDAESGDMKVYEPGLQFKIPFIESVKVNKVGKVRRAKLFYLRERQGKSARIKEKRVVS